jgi:hypothetical protein
MDTTILAADLGKFNSVLCWYDTTTRNAIFKTIRTSTDELRQELTRQPVSLVVFEACSQAGWVHDLCEELSLKPLVASTTGTAWQWKRVKRKTDRGDSSRTPSPFGGRACRFDGPVCRNGDCFWGVAEPVAVTPRQRPRWKARRPEPVMLFGAVPARGHVAPVTRSEALAQITPALANNRKWSVEMA